MPDPLTIEFAMTGLDKVTGAFDTLAGKAGVTTARMQALTKALDDAADAYRRLNAEAARYNQQGGSNPAVNIGRGVARNSNSGQSSSGFVSGPFQRQERLGQQLSQAISQGNGRAAADVRLAQVRNDRSIERAMAGPKGLGDKIADVIKTSRFSVGGGNKELMPLVGRTLSAVTEALGPEVMAFAGPIGLAATAATAAATAIFNLAKASAEAGAAYARFTYAIGSNGPAAAQANTLGRAMGLDPGGTAAMADSLNSAITGSALGRMYGQRVGVFNQGGPYGNVDKASELTTAIEGLRQITSFDERVRTMNALGLQGASSAVMMSSKQYAFTKDDSATKTGIMDPDFQQKSVDFQASLARVGDAFDNLMVVIGKPAMGAIINVLNNVADGLNNFATFLNSPAMQTVLQVLEAASGGGMLAFSTKADDPHTAAQKETTQAIREQTALMKTPGVYGRDTDGRLGKAMPSAVGFGANARARSDAMAMGRAYGAF